MTDLYAELQAEASEILAEFKQGSVKLMCSTPGASDPDKPWVPGTPTTQTYDLAAAVNGVSAKHVDGTLILATDLVVTCAVAAVTPRMGDKLTIDGVEKAIKKISPRPAAGTPVAFLIFVAG